ncbi:ABC transporter permease [Nocardiopsis composta]|uniref:Osmoprotectant transport system permease protein n=1 Tax=Nocardiopsis composta TaxID=157465 RepID=A0A7W8QIB8_9ACTN|nr:ABC transporter permease subunit [Nocardiopsis composta]MBB5430906.1 osmoprotectant transport system permease protein [Nocardiopsis composta]
MTELRWLSDNTAVMLEYLLAHAWLSVAPLLLGLALALPLGWAAYRSRRLYRPLVAASSLLYTLPSLALFVLLPQVLGTRILDPLNIVCALTLYTVALLVRVVADALASVPEETVRAADALGYRPLQRWVLVELPIAVPVITAGLRVASVSNVSLVSLGALLGVPQLGSLFTLGFQLGYLLPVAAGIVLCLLLAWLLDAAIVLAGRALTPWKAVVTPV